MSFYRMPSPPFLPTTPLSLPRWEKMCLTSRIVSLRDSLPCGSLGRASRRQGLGPGDGGSGPGTLGYSLQLSLLTPNRLQVNIVSCRYHFLVPQMF